MSEVRGPNPAHPLQLLDPSSLFLFIVDRAGRRIPWLISSSVCSLCLLYLVVYTKVANTTAKVLSESTKEGGNGATAFVMIYALFWSFGGNGLPWIVSSEIFPSRVRSLTGAYGAMVQWLASFVSTRLPPHGCLANGCLGHLPLFQHVLHGHFVSISGLMSSLETGSVAVAGALLTWQCLHIHLGSRD